MFLCPEHLEPALALDITTGMTCNPLRKLQTLGPGLALLTDAALTRSATAVQASGCACWKGCLLVHLKAWTKALLPTGGATNVMQCTVAVGTCASVAHGQDCIAEEFASSDARSSIESLVRCALANNVRTYGSKPRHTCMPVHGAKLVARLPPKPQPPMTILFGTSSPAYRNRCASLTCIGTS